MESTVLLYLYLAVVEEVLPVPAVRHVLLDALGGDLRCLEVAAESILIGVEVATADALFRALLLALVGSTKRKLPLRRMRWPSYRRSMKTRSFQSFE